MKSSFHSQGKTKEDEDGQNMQNDRETNGLPAATSVSRLLEHASPYHKSGFFGNKLMFGWRNLIKIKHIPEQFMDVLITPIMFTFMFTFLFGGALAGSTRAYLQFFIPGILVQTVTFNAMYAGININNDVSKGIFDRFRSMPIWLPAPLSGIFIGDFFRHLISGTLVLIVRIYHWIQDGCRYPGIRGLLFDHDILLDECVLDIHHYGTYHAQCFSRDVLRMAHPDAPCVYVKHLCRSVHHAEMAPDLYFL